MIILFVLIIVGFLFFYLISLNYKKLIIKELSKKEHPLKNFYGLTMFIEDKYLYKIRLLNKLKAENTLKMLYVKDKVGDIAYIYKIKRITLCLLIFIVFIIVGFIKCIEGNINNSQKIQMVERPEFGQGSTIYDFNAIIEGNDQPLPVQIKVDEIKYTEAEIINKLEKTYKKLLPIFLGDNKSKDEITKDLKLINKLDGVNISWEIEYTKLIDYNGRINREDVYGEGELIYLSATLSFEKIEKKYEIPIVIMAADNGSLSLEDEIKKNLDISNDIYEKEVKLPLNIDEKKIHFLKVTENQTSIFLLLAIISGVFILYAQNHELKNKIKKRDEEMMMDYAEIVSKITLLSEAGLSIKRSWNRIVEDYERDRSNKIRYAYEEMRLSNIKMKNGTPEGVAYEDFGRRCNLQPYIRLGGLLEQNITKGNKGMKMLLENEVRGAFEDRKNLAKVRGEEASTKLLIPMLIMLVLVIIIIIVPAFSSMNF